MKLDTLEATTVLLLLRSLALTKYEARAYWSLIKNGPQNCRSLSRSTDIPSGRIYSVMNSLGKEEWVKVSVNERPKIYYAVDPEIIIQKRLIEMKKEFHMLEIQANRVSAILHIMFSEHATIDYSLFGGNNHFYKQFLALEGKK
jgi:sugar-specific transcriptional regulator TrmB